MIVEGTVALYTVTCDCLPAKAGGAVTSDEKAAPVTIPTVFDIQLLIYSFTVSILKTTGRIPSLQQVIATSGFSIQLPPKNGSV